LFRCLTGREEKSKTPGLQRNEEFFYV
jgi:hypothetical protein